MCAEAGKPSFIQNQNLVCMTDCADALGDNQYRSILGFIRKRMAQCRIRLEVKS